jgi:hypothetical protein
MGASAASSARANTVDEALVETLLRKTEGDALDFKRDHWAR